jgi:hypothetical protein
MQLHDLSNSLETVPSAVRLRNMVQMIKDRWESCGFIQFELRDGSKLSAYNIRGEVLAEGFIQTSSDQPSIYNSSTGCSGSECYRHYYCAAPINNH